MRSPFASLLSFGALAVGCSADAGGAVPLLTAGPNSADAATSPDAAREATTAGSRVELPLSILAGAVPSCGAADAHPNVCCASGPDQATVCTESVERPFDACVGSLTFPDPRTCCPLDAGGPCMAPISAVEGGTTDPACAGTCSVGGYLPTTGPGCCNDFGCEVPGVCACPASSSLSDGGRGLPCNCAAPSCAPCPSGWYTPSNAADLCCRTASDATTECFSQAAAIGALHPTGIRLGYVTTTGCAYVERTADGHVEAADCDISRAPACSCKRDGVVVQTLATSPGCPVDIASQDESGVRIMTACGFSE